MLGGLSLPAPAWAGDGPANLWQSFVVGDGIPSGNVLAAAIAQDGSLWFGTDAGAGHYNGAWSSLTEREGLPSGRIRAIVETDDGALWFGTDAGLARRAPDGRCCATWTTDKGLPDNDVYTLAVSAVPLPGGQGAGVWVGTKRGLVYVDSARVVRDEPVPDAAIQATAVTTDGELLVSVAGAGVWRRDREGAWQAVGNAAEVQSGPLALWVARDGRIWAGSQNGLVYYQDGRWQELWLTEDTTASVLAIMQDLNGDLWAGTDQGVFNILNASSASPLVIQSRAQKDGLVNDHVRVIASDHDGGLWFGTIGGVSRYAGNLWPEVRNDDLADQRINALLTDHAGRTWIGTERNGLILWENGKTQRFVAANGLPDDRIFALFEDEAGRIWVGAGTGVGYLRAGEAWRFERISDRLRVYAFGQDSHDVLWLAADDGLYRWGQETGLDPAPELAGKRVNAIHLAGDGILWAGTQAAGLLRLADGKWQGLTETDDGKPLFNDVVVNGIAELADGSLWVGTYNEGLWKYHDGRWTRMDANLASPKILALMGRGQNLWVGTRQGFARYDSQTWQTYNGDALPSANVLAFAPGKEGTLWVGTLMGLVHYEPEMAAPWVSIESVNLLPLQGGGLRLTGDTIQALRVRGGDLATNAADLVFLVQLEGVDTAPQVYRDTQITAYSGRPLPSGAYRLQVRAHDAAFNYSAPAEAQIIVPRMVTLPGGFKLGADVFYPMLGLGLVALASVMLAGGVSLRARVRDRRRAAQVSARQREALERAFNPYISGEPVRQADMFFGRDELLRRIFNALHQNSIMIHGERRMGKTTLLYQLAEQLRRADDAEWTFIPVYIDLEGTPQTRFFYALIEAIWGVLQAYLLEDRPPLRFPELWPDEYTDREFIADLKLILASLKEASTPRQVRVILLLDEMDVVSSYDTVIQQQLRRVFMSSLATALGAVVAGIQISKAWDRVESPWYNMFNEIALEPFTEEQARQLLLEPVQGVYEWDPEAVEFVLRQAEGRPYRLQQYALEAVNQMLAAKRLCITLADVEVAHEIVERSRVS